MSLRAKTKYVPPSKPAVNAGVTLFCSAEAVACHWIRLVLAEKDVGGLRLQVQIPGRVSEDLAQLNPAQSLPTLSDRDTVVYPARLIAEYLDERYPHPPMFPLEPGLRARLRMVMGHLEHDLFPQVAVIEGGGNSGRAARKRLGAQLAGSARLFPSRQWFLGMDFSLVDCAWAALLWRLATLKLELPAGGEALHRYAERVFARPRFSVSLIHPRRDAALRPSA
jgi:RNA polymerase-associated protein